MSIDELLTGMDIARQSMEAQVTKINETLEKSNKVLLHMESKSTQKILPSHCSTSAYNISRDSENALVKIIEQFQTLVQQPQIANTQNFSQLDGCLAYRQHVEFLGSGVRKLMALCNVVVQMKQNLQQRSDGESDGDEEIEPVESDC